MNNNFYYNQNSQPQQEQHQHQQEQSETSTSTYNECVSRYISFVSQSRNTMNRYINLLIQQDVNMRDMIHRVHGNEIRQQYNSYPYSYTYSYPYTYHLPQYRTNNMYYRQQSRNINNGQNNVSHRQTRGGSLEQNDVGHRQTRGGSLEQNYVDNMQTRGGSLEQNDVGHRQTRSGSMEQNDVRQNNIYTNPGLDRINYNSLGRQSRSNIQPSFGIQNYLRQNRQSSPTPFDMTSTTENILHSLSQFMTPVPIVPTDEQIRMSTREIIFENIENPFNTACPITHENFSNDDNVLQLRCGHIFNTEAIRRWLRSNVTCPMCRFDLRDSTENGWNNVNVIQDSNNEENNSVTNTTSSNVVVEDEENQNSLTRTEEEEDRASSSSSSSDAADIVLNTLQSSISTTLIDNIFNLISNDLSQDISSNVLEYTFMTTPSNSVFPMYRRRTFQ
jgi:hypothetical protein